MEERYPQTIPQDLFDAWKIMLRFGDVKQIVKSTGISRPIIDRAIKYGHVKNASANVTKKISDFFEKRHNKEQETGGKLISLAKQN